MCTHITDICVQIHTSGRSEGSHSIPAALLLASCRGACHGPPLPHLKMYGLLKFREKLPSAINCVLLLLVHTGTLTKVCFPLP